MERRFKVRLDELLDDAEVDDAVFQGVLPRLDKFLQPFYQHLQSSEQECHVKEYIAGLTSDLDRKNGEAIAYFHDHDRQTIQKFIGQALWDHQPLLIELARQVGMELGEADGVIVFDVSAYAKKGNKSVGVQRQWCGRLGKVENSQVGVYMAYVSHVEHALVDERLYLPKEWAKDKERRTEAGVPKEIRFKTRHELALAMLQEKGPLLPHAWIAGDDEMGRSTQFRRNLQALQERYLLAVPSNTLIRVVKADPPPYSGHGPRPKVPFVRADQWANALPETVWETINVRDGEKGPLVVKAAKVLVQGKTDRRRTGPEEVLVVTHTLQEDGTNKRDYYLSNADEETPLREFVRVASAEHRIEECFKRAKSEAGLADYQVRTWKGWHHHQTLSLLATWFLTQETRRGKKMDPGDHDFPDSVGHCSVAA